MSAGPTTLKLAGGLGTLIVCGASGAVVAVSAKPASAPLRPPVDPHASIAGGAPASAAAQPPSLTIPVTPTCGSHNSSETGQNGGAAVDQAVQQALNQLRTATSAQARSQLLQQAMKQLNADERQQLTAAIANRTTGRQGAMSCRGGGGQLTSPPDAGIQPSVVDAPASSTPLTVSSVS